MRNPQYKRFRLQRWSELRVWLTDVVLEIYIHTDHTIDIHFCQVSSQLICLIKSTLIKLCVRERRHANEYSNGRSLYHLFVVLFIRKIFWQYCSHTLCCLLNSYGILCAMNNLEKLAIVSFFFFCKNVRWQIPIPRTKQTMRRKLKQSFTQVTDEYYWWEPLLKSPLNCQNLFVYHVISILVWNLKCCASQTSLQFIKDDEHYIINPLNNY